MSSIIGTLARIPGGSCARRVPGKSVRDRRMSDHGSGAAPRQLLPRPGPRRRPVRSMLDPTLPERLGVVPA
ncbi:MAG: hypothetical protein Q6373_007550 [Candidatus Sigynarchaeota archaeon]